jgi:hypothetical protein
MSPLAAPAGYPCDLADDELVDALRRMFDTSRVWAEFDTLLPELQLPIIAALLGPKREGDAPCPEARKPRFAGLSSYRGAEIRTRDL